MSEEEINIINNANISANSKKTYVYSYERLMVLTDNVPISNVSEKRMVKILKDSDAPANSINVMLSVVLMIRREREQSIDLLLKFKGNKLVKKMDIEKMEKNDELQRTLPSYDTYMTYVDDLYKQKNWRSYIVNYLLIKYGVRNMDLNLIITRDKYAVSKRRGNNQVNYLYVTKKYIKLVRNIYKTSSSYGRKEDTIYSTKFMYAVNELLADQFEAPLLNVEEQSVGQTIRAMTYNSIAEGGVYKVITAHYKSRGDINKLKALAESRGHLVDTQIGYYDISNPN